MAAGGNRKTISGRYVLAPNPCTTEPCLPGMAYAVESGGRDFFLTVGGRWSAEARRWSGWTPEPGDAVKVTGRVEERTDIRGGAFLTIEVETLVRS